MRTAALFAVPVWLAYVLWSHRSLRLVAPAAIGLALPLVAYSMWHAAETGRFGLTQADGWFLYGRVGEIADCGGADIPARRAPAVRAQRRATGARARRTTSGTPTARRGACSAA